MSYDADVLIIGGGASGLIAACAHYEAHTGRRITFEYTLIKGFNDSPACAKELIRLLKPLKNRHVNLISVNPVEGREFERCTKEDIFTFQKLLSAGQINATVRRTMGSDISGSCGQLKRKERS
jgi:23S rRNA (adenine2503-C2)-methyltransferase